MSKDTAEGQGIIADLVTMFVGAPAVAMGAKAAAKKALKKVANPVGPVQMAKFRAGRKLGNLKDRAKDVSSLAKVTKQMATGKGRALVKQAAKDLSGPTVKNQSKTLPVLRGRPSNFLIKWVWYSKGAKEFLQLQRVEHTEKYFIGTKSIHFSEDPAIHMQQR